MLNNRKLMLIGLDGGTFEVFLPLIEKGVMPNLAQLMRESSWGSLYSTIPPFTAAAWTSLATGTNPGKHGLVSFQKRDSFHYVTSTSNFVSAQQVGLTLWEILSKAERKVGIVNVPITYPARPVNGYMITGMLTPIEANQFTYPPELKDSLNDYIIDVDFLRKHKFVSSPKAQKEEILRQVNNMTRIRIRTCLQLLQQHPWDFFMVVFTGTDRIFHFLWDDLTKMLKSSYTPYSEQLLSYFKDLDTGIGNLIQEAGTNTTTMILSDHGFGASPTKRLYLNVWLEQSGFLTPRTSVGPLDLEYWRFRIGRNKKLKALLRKLIPQHIQDKTISVATSINPSMIDWEETKAYFVPIYFNVCGIEINLKGKHQAGFVKTEEYEPLRQEIIKGLSLLKDETGTPIVEAAISREALYSGPYVSDFPDIIIILNPDYLGAASIASKSIIEPHSPSRPGEHRQNGIFIANGDDIIPQANIRGLNLIDVPPTILYLLDLPIPSHFDGRVLTEITSDGFQKSHPISIQDYGPILTPKDSPNFTEEQTQLLEQRLRGLGYLE